MLQKQIINFILVGIFNTIVGYAFYAFFIYLGFNYIYAIFFATVLGVLFNFKTIGGFVFKTHNNLLIEKFILVYVIVFIVNILVIKVLKLYNFDDYIAGFFAIIPCAIISFVLNKYFVFKDKK